MKLDGRTRGVAAVPEAKPGWWAGPRSLTFNRTLNQTAQMAGG